MTQNYSSKEEYISLTEAAEYCDYTQEYLSLRARQGKLKAEKIGRNWVTTKEWVEEYFGETNSPQARAQEKKANGFSFSTNTYFSAVKERIGEAKEAIGKLKTILQTPELRRVIASVLVFVFFGVGLTMGAPSLFVARDLFVEGLAVFSEETNKGVSRFSQDTGEVSDRLYKVVIFKERAYVYTEKFQIVGVIDNMKYGLEYTGRMVSGYTQWLNHIFVRQALVERNLAEQNIAAATASVSSSGKSFYDKYVAANNWVEEKIVGCYNAIACFWRKDGAEAEKQIVKKDIEFKQNEVDILEENIMSDIQERFENFRESSGLQKKGQGAIIAPLKPGQDAKDEIIKLKNKFSDEVEIQPEDENSGIITPIFREKRGDEYLYLIVPVRE